MKNRSERFFRTFDLPIMRPAGRVLKLTETALCRHIVGVPTPVSLPLVRSIYVFKRVYFGDSVQLLLVTSGPYQLFCIQIRVNMYRFIKKLYI